MFGGTLESVALRGVDPDQTVTADLHKEKVRGDQALRQKGMNTAGVNVLHENSRDKHAVKVEHLGWKLLPHPPYTYAVQTSHHNTIGLPNFPVDTAFTGIEKFRNREEMRIWVSIFFES